MKRVTVFTLLFVLGVSGCDIYKPQISFRLAIPEKDYFYNYMASHLVPFLEENGYRITIVRAASSIEANRLVAQGKADLSFVNNHSVPLAEELGEESGNLRSILPLTTRLLFAFSKEPLPPGSTAKHLLEGKRVGVELLGGEAALNLQRFLSRARIQNSTLVTFQDNPDVVVFWGTFYGERASRYLQEGWHPFSFNQGWIEFLSLNDPALRPYKLPAIPGEANSIEINTIATEAVLVANQNVGENSVYKLAELIFQRRLQMVHRDIMYRSINEGFDPNSLLFALHDGTAAYLRRDEPTFFERYADTIALVLSIIAVVYGGLQAIRNSIAKRKKDQVDKYFLEFLEIRSSEDVAVKVKQLDALFQRAVEQLTSEKLDKSDFHILSRLIQQELTMLRFRD